ncbi:ABC transporter permease [Qiania dongpingensis]|uniref:ABC transporter permease n=1 Tax=Qiania dongpingensis TaxID=2763669 RepID=A0A7G9G155_9FIRM|nr:ABC transporter permease [Qiania dongpingensis]QNM04537.1 ABC transporter permease [Qiania dongpingensis]
MFINIFGKRIKAALRNWSTLIWTWIFPIMLATLFFFAFSALDEADLLTVIPIGIVDNKEYGEDTVFRSALDSLSADGDDKLFEVTVYPSAEDAGKALENQDIDGYITLENTSPNLTVSDSGLNQTIIKSFLDQYSQTEHAITDILAENPGKASEISKLFDRESFTKEISLTKNPPSQTVNYFYALLAMVCMYGAFQGHESVSYLQANLSPLGARRTLSPAKRLPMVVYDLLASFAVHVLCLMMLVAYIVLVLGVDFGSNLWMVILTCGLGSLLGIAFGALISAATKFKEGMKVALIITITMVCSYGAGLMVSGINYTIAQKLPVLSWLNPAARIADSFYCLYYYDDLSKYFLNLGILAAMTFTMFIITAFFLRRQRYESI